MVKRTYAQMKTELVRIMGTTGFNISDPRALASFNSATQELMNEGDWPGVVDRYLFSVTDGNIVLPSFLDRIMGVAINNLPYEIRSPWFEFVEYGPGFNNGCDWIDVVIDRDEQPISGCLPVGTGWVLSTVGEVDETVVGTGRPFLTVQGRMVNKRNVRSHYVGTGYIDGERLYINGDTPDYTYVGTGLFDQVTAVVKPLTNGYVELWAQAGAEHRLLATFGPNETNPSYHAYFLPQFKSRDNSGYDAVLVRGRKRYYDVINDDDVVIISNVQAMRNMIMAIQKSSVSDFQGYAAYKTAAVDIMNKEAKSYRGNIRTPALTFQRGSPMGEVPFIR